VVLSVDPNIPLIFPAQLRCISHTPSVKRPQALSTVLHATLREFGLEKKAQTYTVLMAWPEIVGEKVAAMATAEKLDRGILHVRVSSPVWRFELKMREREILQKIEQTFGPGHVRDIQWK
jgi:predicted nucleic acid-binding Zn ribbon protein